MLMLLLLSGVSCSISEYSVLMLIFTFSCGESARFAVVCKRRFQSREKSMPSIGSNSLSAANGPSSSVQRTEA